MCDEKMEGVLPSMNDEQSKYRSRFNMDHSPLPLDSLEDTCLKPQKELWTFGSSQKPPNILDPDDPLMKRFQDALNAHLTRIDKRLTDEILDLEAAIKMTSKECEEDGLKMYGTQQEIARQQTTIENYQSTLEEIMRMHEEKEQQIGNAKELHKQAYQKLQAEKAKEEKLVHELESLASLQRQFAEWEKEIASNLIISQRMSEKDAAIQRDLIRKKQQGDYILFKLMEEVWKVENEIKNLSEQLQFKDKEKTVASQTIADANADLEALQREYKNLCGAWNSVVTNVGQRDKIYDELNAKRQKIRESFRTLQSQIDKVKKETGNEMENNERLTSLHARIEEDIQCNVKTIAMEKEKVDNLEIQLIKKTRLAEQVEGEYNAACSEYQYYCNSEKLIEKDYEKLANERIELENKILAKLEEKVSHDKAARYLNKLLRSAKDEIREKELAIAQAENTYGKAILEIERLNTIIANNTCKLDELTRGNNLKEKEIEETQMEIKRCEVIVTQKQRKIDDFNKKIDEILSTTGGEEISLQDVKVTTLEKNIEELELKNQKSQQFWLRQESNMVTLSQQRNVQLQEVSLLNKQITIMEQKNLKLNYELDRQRKEEANMNKMINLLQQKLVQLNCRLASRKELKEELEDKNCLTKSEYVKSLQQAEMDIIKLQSDIKQLESDKVTLKEQLNAAQQESLSWEKKVQLVSEAKKSLKNEHSIGGDVTVMKNEIHKMEMRLSHLRKAQEKLIQDMEFCIVRRDVIMNGAMAKEKRNPKGQHNQKVIVQKRFDAQKLKIKQLMKDTKQLEDKILEMRMQEKEILKKLNDGQETLKTTKDVIVDIGKQISEAEFIKFHNLEILIRKQHKVKMLQDIKNGHYKMLFKSEVALDEELQKQQSMNNDLKEIMEQTKQDFPLLVNDIHKILLTLQAS